LHQDGASGELILNLTNIGAAHNTKKSTTDYTDDTDGEVDVTDLNPFHISAIRAAIRGNILVNLS
jgi:hypothetical protein